MFYLQILTLDSKNVPIINKISIITIPYLKSDVRETDKEKSKGPINDVALPENAKKPKNSLSLPLGINRAIRDLLDA